MAVVGERKAGVGGIVAIQRIVFQLDVGAGSEPELGHIEEVMEEIGAGSQKVATLLRCDRLPHGSQGLEDRGFGGEKDRDGTGRDGRCPQRLVPSRRIFLAGEPQHHAGFTQGREVFHKEAFPHPAAFESHHLLLAPLFVSPATLPDVGNLVVVGITGLMQHAHQAAVVLGDALGLVRKRLGRLVQAFAQELDETAGTGPAQAHVVLVGTFQGGCALDVHLAQFHVLRLEPGKKVFVIEGDEGILCEELGTVHLKADAPGNGVEQGIGNDGRGGDGLIRDKNKGVTGQLEVASIVRLLRTHTHASS